MMCTVANPRSDQVLPPGAPHTLASIVVFRMDRASSGCSDICGRADIGCAGIICLTSGALVSLSVYMCVCLRACIGMCSRCGAAGSPPRRLRLRRLLAGRELVVGLAGLLVVIGCGLERGIGWDLGPHAVSHM